MIRKLLALAIISLLACSFGCSHGDVDSTHDEDRAQDHEQVTPEDSNSMRAGKGRRARGSESTAALEKRVDQLEKRVGRLESTVGMTGDQFGYSRIVPRIYLEDPSIYEGRKVSVRGNLSSIDSKAGVMDITRGKITVKVDYSGVDEETKTQLDSFKPGGPGSQQFVVRGTFKEGAIVAEVVRALSKGRAGMKRKRRNQQDPGLTP